MTHSGTDVPPPAQPAAEAPAEKSGAKKWLPIAGSVAAVGVLGVGSMTGWFGIGDPKVGDCVQMQGETSFEVVDCGAEHTGETLQPMGSVGGSSGRFASGRSRCTAGTERGVV